MQSTPNRRVQRSERFPARIAVELDEGDPADAFEADVLDFTRAGVSMRAAYLPEIGTQLVCRFRCMPSGRAVSARGEVVWAQLEGGKSGEFGLAFVDLDPRTEWLIEEMLAEPIGEHVGSDEASESIAQLELEGSAEPIAARLTRRDAGKAVFEQHLDLLSLGRGVRAHAPGASDRSGSIAGVELRMVGNVPMLAVTVNFESETSAGAVDAAAVDAAANLPHDTVHDASAPDFAWGDELDAAGMQSVTLTEFRIAERGAPRRGGAPRRADHPARQDGATEFAIATPGDELDESEHSAEPAAWLVLRDQLDAAWSKLLAALAPLRAQIEARGQELATRLGEHQGRALVSLREFFHKELVTRVGAVRRLARRRRTTASPTAAPRRSALGLSPAALALSVAGAFAAFVIVYALVWRDAPEDQVVIPAGVPAVDSPEAIQPEVDRAGLDALAELDTSPRTLPGVRRMANAAPLAEGSKAAKMENEAKLASIGGEARPEPRGPLPRPRFGAAKLTRAKRFPLRVSAPVTELHGTADAEGFKVIIPGVHPVSRAAPLRSANRAVASAMIVNRGDHSELSVRFVKGMKPAYQVTGEGDTLYVAIQAP
jgi:hypothetical protein